MMSIDINSLKDCLGVLRYQEEYLYNDIDRLQFKLSEVQERITDIETQIKEYNATRNN